ncbi:MAG: nucleotide sugar dehydrogenase [Rikenellaceae bacterium]
MMELRVAVIGLGYVGLPLARLFSTKYKSVGYDIDCDRVEQIMSGVDSTMEVENELLQRAISENGLICTCDLEMLRECNIYIVTVPTPIDRRRSPDLTPLYRASEAVGSVISIGDIVIYESTVYPGVTENECVPILEEVSGLTFNVDFFAGYSPERINPGDHIHTVESIKKITSGSTPEVAKVVDDLYASVITAGTHLAPTIKVAEAAKVIENTQRDVNIALINEFARIFERIGVDTQAVIDAASTKWNFLPFRPGLVGGHCIGVDPYYLAHCAIMSGYNPDLILSGRKINEDMSSYVATQIVKTMIHSNIAIMGAEVLMMGVSFKPNCPDIRNTKVVDVVRELTDYGISVSIYDPHVDVKEVARHYGVFVHSELPEGRYDALVIAVAHDEFRDIDFSTLTAEKSITYDINWLFDSDQSDGRL